MTLYADSNYSFNPWMRDIQPQMRPDLGQIDMTESEEMLAAFALQSPVPPPAGFQPRFGAVKTIPTVEEVLGVPAQPMLREGDTGNSGSGGPALGKW